MTIPEKQLEAWAGVGALAASETTYTSIKAALDAYKWPAGMRYEVYLQGSYRNKTNTRGDSDVDVIAELTSNATFDTSALLPGDAAAVARTYTPVRHTFDDFRDEVEGALNAYYGYFGVINNEKCFHVSAASGRLGADVVPCMSLHKYYPGRPRADGITFQPRLSSRWLENYPKLHFAHGAQKNAATREYFKPMARIFKNARKVINDGRLWSISAPSHFLECLLYNVPDAMFGTSYQDTFRNSVEWLALVLPTAVGEAFTCQHEQLALFGDRPEQWTRDDAISLVGALGELWKEWYDDASLLPRL